MIRKVTKKVIKKISLYSILVRGGAVILFSLIIGLFLYAPDIYHYFLVQDDELTIYITRETIPEETFERFTKETGIKVRTAYFDTNEELLAKLKINRGVGYDLLVPSDYMVELLIKEGLLQPLDHAQLETYKQLDDRLLNRHYDPGNKYTVPVSWIPYGIAYNRNIINLDNREISWDIIFKKNMLPELGDYQISMLNDAREVVFLGLIYLFGNVDNITEEKLEKVKELLIKQKEMVECYTETGAKYLLLSDIVPIAVLPAARLKEMDDMTNYGFTIPKEGSLLDILNIGISIASKKKKAAHELIEFLTSKVVSAYSFEALDCNPANEEAFSLIDASFLRNKAFFPDDEVFDRLFVLHNNITPVLLEKLWFSVKSA